jgi:uracil-DNA glycosylase family 4
VSCEECPRLREHCLRVALERKRQYRDQVYWGRPVPGLGDPRARLLIVGLAPAAHGANRTGRMFTGDSSGDWLWEALHRFGFASLPHSVSRDDGQLLADAYITAAARCAPPGNRPDRVELERCRRYLTAELGLLPRVRVVLALGGVAHEAWLRASGRWEGPPRAAALGRREADARGEAGPLPRERPRFSHGAEARFPDGIILLSSYHPSRQNTNTGRLTRAMWHSVFRRVRRLLDAAPPRPGRR